MVHPDVRRMLLLSKSTTEGMRALALWIAMHIDISEHHEDADTRQKADDLVALLTPVAKSYITERGFLNISESMQVTGGAGYTTDWSIEQYMRDSRIGLIYEGTNHIQALDLVGRKLPMAGGRLYQVFNGEISALIKANADNPAMAEFLGPLKEASKALAQVTMALAEKGMKDPEEAGAVASNYLNIFALVALAYCWCRMVSHSLNHESKLSPTKIKTARFFFRHVLPGYKSLLDIVAAGKAEMMDFDLDEF
jgi:hypothetical protein